MLSNFLSNLHRNKPSFRAVIPAEKYPCTNQSGKQDIFIASSILNAAECTVRFNG